MRKINLNYDLVIIGGGMSGVCAALAAARHGAKTALIHNRPVLGGNASSEFKMHICGADRHANHKGLRETGILEEILLETKRTNSNPDFWALDVILWEKCSKQPGLTLYLNTHVYDVASENNHIKSLCAIQMTTETEYTLNAPLFMDATGDATIAHLSGAETRTGRESRDEYGEKWAPEKADNCTMGSSLMFTAKDMGHPVTFEKPDWAYSFSEEELENRGHSEITSGYWWIELGGDKLDTIDDAEIIRDELIKSLMGIWDHIKNGGDHKADNYALDWMAFLPGKRESRRVIGDYVLREQDLLEERVFDDAVAYGGWSMDCHIPGGLRSSKEEPTQFLGEFGAYTIPYRCLYSKNIDNLFVVGRPISVSHMAFSSTRVMATCAVVGQAGGTAAAIAAKMKLTPREVSREIKQLQLTLAKDDCWLPGIQHNNPADEIKTAVITASGSEAGHEADNISNGWQRAIGQSPNSWAAPMSKDGAWIRAKLQSSTSLDELILRFDSNLNVEIMPSISKNVLNKQKDGIPDTLVKSYTVQCSNNGQPVHIIEVKNNSQRLNRHSLEGITADEILVTITETNGDTLARIFEINAYRKN